MIISAEHPFTTVKKEVTKICQPLFSQTPFKHFCYERYNFDGLYLSLGLQREYFNAVLKNKLLPTIEELQKNAVHYTFLSPILNFEAADIPAQNKIVENIKMGNEFEVYHRLCLVFNTAQYVEIFIFGLTEANKKFINTLNIFMNHVNLLEKFCVYFREVSSDLVKQVEGGQVVYDDVKDPLLFKDLNFKSNCAYSDFLAEIKLKKYRIQGKGGICTLSKREFECLFWTTKDKTAKQIGRILSLSDRTVESYLVTVKNKLGCESKLELGDIALNNPIIKAFSDN